jgi:glycosyltransferase involved in cell wall biosynthesis
MDVVALPSYREGLGTVSLEGASMGLPVVATRVPGCTDAVVDGVTGTLVPPMDAKALADALRLYLTQPELRRAHGSAGRARIVQDFRQEAIWSAMVKEYRELLTTRGVPWPGEPAVAEG